MLFFQTAALGAGAEVMATAMAAFFTGRGVTWIVMVVDSSASALNVVLDYALIFGHFGLPSLGIEGAALATVISLWWRVVVYAALILLPRYRRYGIWSGRRFNAPLFRRLLRYGGPSGLQMLVEIAGFTLFLLVVGTLGERAMAATTLAFNFNTLAFVPMLGLGIALGALVGQQLGRNNPDMAARATWTSLNMAIGYMGTMALVYVLLPDALLFFHSRGRSASRLRRASEHHRNSASVCRRLLFVRRHECGVRRRIEGAGDTRFIMIVSLLLTPLPVGAAWAGIHYFHGGLIWCWIVITVWVCVSGLIYCAASCRAAGGTCE